MGKEDKFLEIFFDEDHERWKRRVVEKAHIYKKTLAKECQEGKRAPDWYEKYLLNLAKFDISLYSKN